MGGGTLKSESLVFEGKRLGSGRANGGVFKVNHNNRSAEQNGRRQSGGDQARKQKMRHVLPGLGARHDASNLLSRFNAAIEFHVEVARTVRKATIDANRKMRIGIAFHLD